MKRKTSPTTWKKGQSGNPKGRPPRGYSISDWFKEMLGNRPEVKQKLANAILVKAIEGDTVAQKMIWQYMDGMPKQDIEANINTNQTFSDEQADKIAERITRRKAANDNS